MGNKVATLDFGQFGEAIHQVDWHMRVQVGKVENTGLSFRNCLIGFYIAEDKLHGANHLNYGGDLLKSLSDKLRGLKISSTGRSQLYNYLSPCCGYRQFVRRLSERPENMVTSLPPSIMFEKGLTPSPQFEIPAENVLNTLAYSHFELFLELDDPLKRISHEIESLRDNLAACAFKGQIAGSCHAGSVFSNNMEFYLARK